MRLLRASVALSSEYARGLSRSEMNEQETLLIKKFRSLSENGKGKIIERLEVILENEIEEKASVKEVG